jgi:hypothetical protein
MAEEQRRSSTQTPGAWILRLIYYSVAFTPDGKYDRQWIQSIRSLRSHNANIPVYLFVFNDISDAVSREAERWQVLVRPLGPYLDWMKSRPHPRAVVLANYPTLHNLIVLTQADARNFSQVLYVDCDTFFFQDPERLFDECSVSDWYAREIPGSRLSKDGLTSNIDENLVTQITTREGLHETGPFNTGVCLLNRDMSMKCVNLQAVFLDFAWRLMAGMLRDQFEAYDTKSRLAESVMALRKLRAPVQGAATTNDLARSLPYPSDNWWILDEIAWMLALGQIDGLSQCTFGVNQVAQGTEFIGAARSQALPVAVHYFSCNEEEFFRCVTPIGPREMRDPPDKLH